MFEKYCKECGECCSSKNGIPVTKKDIKRWNKGGEYGIIKMIEKKEKNSIIPLGNNGYCIFLDKKENKMKCSIYSLRPEVCKNFPLTLSGTLYYYPEDCGIVRALIRTPSFHFKS